MEKPQRDKEGNYNEYIELTQELNKKQKTKLSNRKGQGRRKFLTSTTPQPVRATQRKTYSKPNVRIK